MNRSPTATPATQATSPPTVTTGTVRLTERGTPRSVNRSPRVFDPSMPERLHAVALAPGADLDLAAERGGVEGRQVGTGGIDGRRVQLGADLPRPDPARGPGP